jgi:transposase
MGHSVLLIPAQHVKPFVRGNKTDANDAVAIIEASQRPNLGFVPMKTTHQQDIQCLQRIRDRLVRNRTGLIIEHEVYSPITELLWRKIKRFFIWH